MHYTDKTHFFRDDDDNRQVVITSQVSDCGFDAELIEGEHGVGLVGFGTTRMAAIADLHKAIMEELDQ